MLFAPDRDPTLVLGLPAYHEKVSEEMGDAMRDRAPVGRLGKPDEKGGVIAYLSSRAW